MTVLTADQDRAYKLLIAGYNVFITGPGGSGKSALIKYYYQRNSANQIGITSTTGVSAINIGGATIHSFLGIGLGTADWKTLVAKIPRAKKLLIRKLNTLIIDEVSMLDAALFDKIQLILRAVRDSDEPFGGLQLILTGDFAQLPPVNGEFCFHSAAWQYLHHQIYLMEIIRQTNISFQNALNELRFGIVNDATIKLFLPTIDQKFTDDIKPTKLFAINSKTAAYNTKKLNKLLTSDCERHEYTMKTMIHKAGVQLDRYIQNIRTPNNIILTIGCQVMLTTNLNIKKGLANGSRGVIIKFIDNMPIVHFAAGPDVVITPITSDIEDNGVVVISYTQMPLILGWAVTIHKSQGLTLDRAEIDMQDIFEYGMAYTALSRVRNVESLILKNVNWARVRAHPESNDYYEQLIEDQL